MNNNEIMNNEVVEATEEVIENAGLSKGVKIAAGIGLSVVVGVVVYKYVTKSPVQRQTAMIGIPRCWRTDCCFRICWL